MSTAEVWAQGTSNTITTDTGRDNTRQLDYYTGVTTNSWSRAIKQLNGSNTYWWLRTAYSINYDYFYSVANYGDWSSDDLADTTHGVSPAFRIA